MHSSNKRVFFKGFEFDVSKEVYEPAEDSFLFAENIRVEHEDRVVDMGTGCGILGIVAADAAKEVVAIDINPFAVRCAKQNAQANSVVHKMSFIQGDLFAALKLRKNFDLILFNAPYLPSEEIGKGSWLDRAWSGGVFGRDSIERFIVEAPCYLRSEGRMLLMQSTLCGVDKTLGTLRKQGREARIIARQDLPFFETIMLIMSDCI